MIDWLADLFEILKFFGLTTPSAASGWVVAVVLGGFSIWRLYITDKKFDEYVNKLTEVLEKQEIEWRELIRKTDGMTYDVIQDTTNSLAILSERINALQLVLLQKRSDKE